MSVIEDKKQPDLSELVEECGAPNTHPNSGRARIMQRPATTVVNVRTDAQQIVVAMAAGFYVYIGRGPGSRWGNPFSGRSGTLAQFRVPSREIAIASYERWIRDQPELMAALPELVGKLLGCWCSPLPCHGHVLIKLLREKGLEP